MSVIIFGLMAIFPQYNWLILALSVIGENLFKESIPLKAVNIPYTLELSFGLGLLAYLRLILEPMSAFEVVVNSLLFGTYLLAISHEMVHKHKLFKYTVFYKEHLKHHGLQDEEMQQRQDNTLPSYCMVRIKSYIMPSKWSAIDYGHALLLMSSLYFNPSFFLMFFATLFVVESIGYLQHSIVGDKAIDWTNKFNNFMAYDCGAHSSHHKEEFSYSNNVGVITGLLACYTWGIICLGLFPLMYLLPVPKSNIAGAYLFGFRQNVANYMAANGKSIKNLVYRMPSVFDNPNLIFQYIFCMLNHSVKGKFEIVESKRSYSFHHDVEECRNYHFNNLAKEKTDILAFENNIIEGHHRYQANVYNKILEIVEMD